MSFLFHEIMHHVHVKKQVVGIILKINFEKAYDDVSGIFCLIAFKCEVLLCFLFMGEANFAQWNF